MSINLPDDFVFPPGFIHPQTVKDAGAFKIITFPDGFSCYVRSEPGEAALIYNEVIVKQEYFKYGLSVVGASCVIDIGANIGIFAMEAKRKAPHAVVYAFEPIPETFHVLEQNMRMQGGSDVHLYNVAIGAQDNSEIVFTFFPNMPGNSTAVPALKEDNKPIMDQMFGKETSDFLHQTETRTVQVRTLSSLIREQGITNIDYLKVDVEGSEISVLDGIEEMHWPIIQQTAIETHTAQLQEQVCDRLVQHGFQVHADLGLSSGMGASLVYGKRQQAG